MACPINQSFTLDCKDNAAGVKTIYLTAFPSDGNSYNPTIASGVVTAWASASSKFFTYQVRAGIATGNDKATINSNGAKFYEPTITTQIEKVTGASSYELDNMIGNRLLMLIELQNGKVFLAGYKNGMDCTEMPIEPGVAMGDFAGYKLSFKGMEPKPMYEVTASLLPALKA